MTRRNAAVLAFCALLVATAPAALATHGQQPEKFPAFYEGQVFEVMMGPSGNSENPNQVSSPCWGLGPDFTEANRSAEVPLFYTLFVPGADQMSCPDGTRMHDMVLTAVPGDPDYNAAVQVMACRRPPDFKATETAKNPYKSEGEVKLGIAAGDLICGLGPVLQAPVTGGPK